MTVLDVTREYKPPRDSQGRAWVDIVDTLVINGVTYERSGYTIDGEIGRDIEASHFTTGKEDLHSIQPHVLCGRCHNDSFTLRYGTYEINATCTKCGFEDTVYDG